MRIRPPFVACIVAFVAVACRAEGPQAGGNAQIVRGMYDAFARGDVPAVLGTLDPEVDWREAEGVFYADRNPYIGPQAVAEGVFQRIVADLENFTVEPRNVIDGGDFVVVEGRYQGRMKATGKPVDAQFVHVWQLRDGKVVRFQQYTDTRQWAEARMAGTARAAN